jgi:ankyrin repeat protein
MFFSIKLIYIFYMRFYSDYSYHIKFLLSISADVDHVDDDGNSALHHAAAWGHTHVGCKVTTSVYR